MSKRWTLRPMPPASEAEKLSAELGVPPLAGIMLLQRGIRTADDAKKFFQPSLNDLHDPFLMKDMDRAAERIVTALGKQERIMVFGDYDVDGTTAVALMHSFLQSLDAEVEYYIPDRYTEGYGVSHKGIDTAKEHGVKLIIALDCGIKSTDKVAYARELGIDFIICDHHRPGAEIPQAVAVLDPKRDDCPYPYKELSGCGIGYKLAQALCTRLEIPQEELEQYLDLVAVSIGADIVPITGENRVLAYFGLQVINHSPRRGFKAMLELAAINRKLTINELVFIIGPRINAAGRMESGSRAVELLVAGEMELAREVSHVINQHNLERRGLDMQITQHALEMIRSDEMLVRRKTTVLWHDSWHKGVVGIVASRLTDKYYRPTILLTRSGDRLTGSARSVKGFDIYDAIDKCSDLLEQFGGHMYAAGLTLHCDNFEAFSRKFEEVVAESIREEMLVPEIEVDAVLQLDEISQDLFLSIQKFQPFGPGNMAPVFMTRGVRDSGYGKVVGNNHLKLEVFHPGIRGANFHCIGFGLGAKMDQVSGGMLFDIVYSIEENEWNGRKSLQLNLKDVRRSG